MKPVINQLIAYKQKTKFSEDIWENRGLIPADADVRNDLEEKLNHIIDNFIELLNKNSTNKQLVIALKNGLKLFDKGNYDTEEKEFIGDVFIELSSVLGININAMVNKWQYGSIMSALMKLSKTNSEKIIEALKQPCSSCGIILEGYVMERDENIPDASWSIAKCNNCEALTLLSEGPGIKRLKFGNYTWLGTLSKNEYDYEQALVKLTQIKFEKNRRHY